MTDTDLRPRFYEGQYLGAGDLSTVVDYARVEHARHALGGHTWGIAMGLRLTEKGAPGAPHRVEVTLQPGFAWDGFARPIAIGRPTRLSEALFAAIPFAPALDGPGGTGRLVEVWLAYDETASGSPQPGFETCATDDEHARIGETFRFVIGQQQSAQQRSPVRIGTNTVDALKAVSTFVPGAPDLYDTSVPHQTFPFADKPPRWLIPIGYVRWIAGNQTLGYFAERALVPADNADARIRAFRRYVGSVTERIEAADGAIVLHERGADPAAPNRFANLLGSAANPADVLSDLVWVEGNLRVVAADAKLAGGKLLLLHESGSNQGVPLYLARRGDDPANPATASRELRVVIGPNSDLKNRLMVGPEVPPVAPATEPSVAPHLVVVSSGDVGIGRRDPETRLNVVGAKVRLQDRTTATARKIDIRTDGPASGVGVESTTDSLTIAASGSAPKNQVLINPGGGAGTAGPVGIRVGQPKHDVDVKGNSIKLGVEEANGGQLVVAPLAPNSVQLEARNTAGSANAPELRIAGRNGGVLPFLHAQAAASQFDGDVGIGAPALGGRLVVASPVPNQGSLAFFTATADMQFNGGIDGVFVVRNTNANGVTSFFQNRMGINTAFPGAPLHVAGDFLFVDGAGIGQHQERAYLGGDGVADDVQIGSTNPQIDRVSVWNTATGWMKIEALQFITSPSDRALKDDIGPIGDPLETVARLRGVRFRWKAGGPTGRREIGLIAQEVGEVVPEAVTTSPRGTGVAYMTLIPLLIEAVKELKGQVEDLRAQVKDLGAAAAKPEPSSKRRAASASKARA